MAKTEDTKAQKGNAKTQKNKNTKAQKAEKEATPKEKSVKISDEKKDTKKEKVLADKKDKKETKGASFESVASDSAQASKDKSKSKLKKHSKKYRAIEGLIEKEKIYPVDEAIGLLKKTSTTKFDSTVEIHVRLGIDIKKTEQQIRGVVVLPNGTGKTKKVCVVLGQKQEKEAKEAGADTVGGEDIIQKIEKGWLDFDVLVATPEMMGSLGKVAKILGPKGLMPNPKTETVTQDIRRVVENIKKGQVEFKNDAAGIVHNSLGKVSFSNENLKGNFETFLDALKKARPESAKGVYLKSIFLTTTMGPSVRVKI